MLPCHWRVISFLEISTSSWIMARMRAFVQWRPYRRACAPLIAIFWACWNYTNYDKSRHDDHLKFKQNGTERGRLPQRRSNPNYRTCCIWLNVVVEVVVVAAVVVAVPLRDSWARQRPKHLNWYCPVVNELRHRSMTKIVKTTIPKRKTLPQNVRSAPPNIENENSEEGQKTNWRNCLRE